ncbi:ShET2/EspL2 family type III secretion system effector toxin [Parendozoicomonas sp. Alg238-R29]|uniref:ShET2/EspL2 family type III secretion system effector toxin n=1 Tax=Parendozoicomonas sp. Alg238-R29 TaxID=2993446 RepID=UPI00248DCF40|nr:ShET2/EspL2 family type III secretion system effector toxin [Parendozoicomonas sp. Alg238-R29]
MINGSMQNVSSHATALAAIASAENTAAPERYLTPCSTASLEKKRSKLIAQRRIHHVMPSSGLIYYSKKPFSPLNGKALVNDQPVLCRHLSYAYAMNAFGTPEHSFDEVDTPEKIATHPAFQVDYHEQYHQHLPQEGYYFHLEFFPQVIHHLIEKYWDDMSSYISTKNYVFYSSNHAMALRFRRKSDRLLITFYDPNDTTRHRKVVLPGPQHAANFRLNHVLDEALIKSYFPGENPTGHITSTETVDCPQQCSAQFYGEPSPVLLSFALFSNTFGTMSAVGVDAMEYVRQTIQNHQLSEKDKVQRLLAQEAGRPPSLAMAFSQNNASAIMAFAEEILSCNLSSAAKAEILGAKGSTEISGLYASFYGGNIQTILHFCTLVLNSSLTPLHKATLLIADNRELESGLHAANRMGDTATVEEFTRLVEQSQLPEHLKAYVLAVGGCGRNSDIQ